MINDKNDSKESGFFESTKNIIKSIKKILGIIDETETISFEISEFMKEVENSFVSFPKKYKKFYELTPSKTNFFVNREKELEKLRNTYENWNKDRFISCAIVAQKGSGISSTLNLFLQSTSKINTIKVELDEKVYTKEEYFRYFNSLFETDNITTNQEFIDYLNNIENSKIIVLENLHHMFLKKVTGFEAIELLFELISYTLKKVFWIGAFTPESWKYLDKTILISNYFTTKICMEPFDIEEIKKVILKRNELANLKIVFTEEGKKQKSQDFLEENFFKQLCKLSNGNISLVLMYWIRSIVKIEKNKIYVKQINKLDNTFIKKLSTEDLFVLQTLILHDGLTLENYSNASDETKHLCRKKFMVMHEKGILIQPKQKFNINPIIYEHIHNYLSSKNYIH